MYLLGTRNSTTQALTTGASVNLGEVYRKFCRKNSCGVKTFDFNGTSVALQQSGMYHITATITFTAPVAGLVIFQLTENGVAIPSAEITQRVTTNDSVQMTGSTIVTLNAGDVLSLALESELTATFNLNANTNASLSVKKLAD